MHDIVLLVHVHCMFASIINHFVEIDTLVRGRHIHEGLGIDICPHVGDDVDVSATCGPHSQDLKAVFCRIFVSGVAVMVFQALMKRTDG